MDLKHYLNIMRLIHSNNSIVLIQLDHQLFALDKLDVLGDKREEVIVCAWDGWTYIVDHDRNVVRYRFPKNVQVLRLTYNYNRLIML